MVKKRACLIIRDRREKLTLQRIIACYIRYVSIPRIITVCCCYYFDFASSSTLLLIQQASSLMIVIYLINKRMLINQSMISMHKSNRNFQGKLLRVSNPRAI